jgi:hypothetical protein
MGSTSGTGLTQFDKLNGVNISAPASDGTNGTPRIAAETHGPAITVHLYMHLGRLI